MQINGKEVVDWVQAMERRFHEFLLEFNIRNYSQSGPSVETLFPFSEMKTLQDKFLLPSIANQATSEIEEEKEAWMKPYILVDDNSVCVQHRNSETNKTNPFTKSMIGYLPVEFPRQFCHSRLEEVKSRNLKPFAWLKALSRHQRLYLRFQPPEPNSFGGSWQVQ